MTRKRRPDRAAFFCWWFGSPDERSDIRATSRVQLVSVQSAEGVDQDQNRNRHAEQPQQQITSHDEHLHRWFDGLIQSGCTCSVSVGRRRRVGWAKRSVPTIYPI